MRQSNEEKKKQRDIRKAIQAETIEQIKTMLDMAEEGSLLAFVTVAHMKTGDAATFNHNVHQGNVLNILGGMDVCHAQLAANMVRETEVRDNHAEMAAMVRDHMVELGLVSHYELMDTEDGPYMMGILAGAPEPDGLTQAIKIGTHEISDHDSSDDSQKTEH